MANNTVVIIPTYNEVENLPLIVDRVLSTTSPVDVVIVDDNSPDGTGSKADELAAAHDEVHVVHRAGKEGLLAAYREGFNWALEHDYDVICQMDADGSHAPEELEMLLAEIDNGADLVIGSRYVEGGEVKDWPRERYLLSKAGNRYISLVLGDDIADMTAGYRAFRHELLEDLDLDSLSDKGYIFQAEIAHRALQAGYDVREVPITFTDRTLGESKLDASFAGQSLAEVTKWAAAEKSELLREGAKEASRFVRSELDNSSLPKWKREIEHAPEVIVNVIGESAKLARYQLDKSGVRELPAKAARAADNFVGLLREGLRIADYEKNRG
ncbi:polyprenol monophosphomannose synthase [Corynebacterium sanguinis]|uniref:polyprenol monophosphomannose synthase n=1 Tax=Corynebacterium sanguinis TaxID=2594913 RepID=UPI001185C429|nr:polyprenol monophosphomannose synthase [Corynebacterium sanguinis]MCT1444703.1 polyprenol monophosphomannose synthase [Corynebacterium sanguinis]MCT1499779.1 polyprenol monophosphomannose synthase [Corynebacterium sanguinis]MCT1883129.1 polyprenol monophosphomannose synthase [Corynebacterium sanguinis]QDR78246.1 polyprenol monophosphomannose synthase [Corynebacterium sanguinis]